MPNDYRPMSNKLRSLASDTAIYGVSTIVQRFLTFFLTPFYTNYLKPAELGEVANLYSIIAFVGIFYSFGLDTAFFRFYRTNNDADDTAHNQKVFGLAFGTIVLTSGMLTILFTVLSGVIASVLGLSVGGQNFVVLSCCIAFMDALALIPYATLRMERRAKRFAFTKALVVLLNVASNLVLIAVLNQGMKGVFLAGVLSSMTGVIILLPELKRYLVISQTSRGGAYSEPYRIDWVLLKEMWRFGLPSVPSAFSSVMLQVADRPIMRWLTNDATVGIYQANYRLGIPMMLVVSVFEYAWKPFFLREAGSRETRTMFAYVLTYFTVMCGAVFLLTALLIEYVVAMPFIGGRFLNPAYLSGLSIIPIVLAGYYFNGLFVNFAASTYIRKRTKYLPFVTGIAAAANVALNLILIPSYGAGLGIAGGAWATLGAYMVMAVLMYCIARRLYPIRYQWGRVTLVMLVTAATFSVAKIMTVGMPILPSIFLRLCCVAGGTVVMLAAAGAFSAKGRSMLRPFHISSKNPITPDS